MAYIVTAPSTYGLCSHGQYGLYNHGLIQLWPMWGPIYVEPDIVMALCSYGLYSYIVMACRILAYIVVTTYVSMAYVVMGYKAKAPYGYRPRPT